MPTTATHNEYGTTTERVLFMAFELSENTWKLGFTTGPGQKPRERAVAARDQGRLLQEIAQAKRRFGLPESAPVVSCYEAGREGFWLHRFLQAQGIINPVGDSSSIEVNRRKRRAKSDALDVRKLLSMLMRYEYGECQVWRVVRVPRFGGRKSGLSRSAPTGPRRRPHRCHHLTLWRDWDREGTGRAGHPLWQSPAGETLYPRQLWGLARAPRGK